MVLVILWELQLLSKADIKKFIMSVVIELCAVGITVAVLWRRL
ncbi:hypothetical protein DSUL_60163 [Desulfovibrionales bacterium]